jgi:hypothetical protein
VAVVQVLASIPLKRSAAFAARIIRGPVRSFQRIAAIRTGWAMTWLAVGLFCLLPDKSHAEPKRLALVIGNSTYSGLPALDACKTAVNGLAGALKRAGYEVTEKVNPSNGQMGAAITEFGESIARAGDAVAVAYVCGYAVALDSRLFLLPASANLSRDTDALSQGIVGRLFVNAVGRSAARGGIVLIDTVSVPGGTPALPLAALVDPAVLGSRGLAAVQTLGAFPAGTTDLAAAAAAGIAGAGAANDWRAVARNLRAKLPTTPQHTVLVYEPSDAPPPVQGGTAATGSDSPRAGSDASTLGPAEYRRIQLALQRLGYYAGKVDGVVGSDTLAAIRRWQHELHVDMTGQLAPGQAERLLKDGQ